MYSFLKGFCAAAALVGTFSVASASATTITFENLPNNVNIPNNYADLTWTNINALNTTGFSASGYVNGVQSGSFVAYNAAGQAGSITSTSSPFTLNSGFFAGAWNDGLLVTAVGFVDGIQTYSKSFTVDTARASLQTFDWTGLSMVTFNSVGGVNHGYSGVGTQFSLDNLTVNEVPAVPEPATWALMLVGFGMAGAGIRARRTHALRITYAK